MSKFKVGDKVRVLKSKDAEANPEIAFMIGKTSEVLGEERSGRYIVECLTEPTDYWFFDEGELGLAEEPVTTVEKSVGDITSAAKGSGARYNTGKPDYSLLILKDYVDTLSLTVENAKIIHALIHLADFQLRHEVADLYKALDVLGQDAMEESTHVFAYGKQKYACWNWARGMPWSVPLACAVRHALKILLKSEYVDEESQRLHTGHIVCNIFMLIHYIKYYKEGNDLPTFALTDKQEN